MNDSPLISALLNSSPCTRKNRVHHMIGVIRGRRWTEALELIGELLDRCTTEGSRDNSGLDVGIDVLSRCHGMTLAFAEEFKATDFGRWVAADSGGYSRYNPLDDKWYVLLRAVARSGMDSECVLPLIEDCVSYGPTSVREACTHALGDYAEVEPNSKDEVRELLIRLKEDRSPMVRESAAEVLGEIG